MVRVDEGTCRNICLEMMTGDGPICDQARARQLARGLGQRMRNDGAVHGASEEELHADTSEHGMYYVAVLCDSWQSRRAPAAIATRERAGCMRCQSRPFNSGSASSCLVSNLIAQSKHGKVAVM